MKPEGWVWVKQVKMSSVGKANAPLRQRGKVLVKAPRHIKVCAVQGTGWSLIWLECLSIALKHINFANKCWPIDSSSNENKEDSDSDQKSLSWVRMVLLHFVLFCLEWIQEQEKGWLSSSGNTWQSPSGHWKKDENKGKLPTHLLPLF